MPYGCSPKLPKVKEVVNEPCPVLYITTEVEGTLESNPPVIGKYRNTLTVYQGSKARVMYDSNGIPTIITGDGGDAGVTEFDDLNGRPKYAGQMMTSATNVPDFTADINDLNDTLSAEITVRAEDDDYLESLIATKQDTLTTPQLEAVNSGADSAKVAQIATNASDISALNGRVTTAEGNIDTIEEKIPAQASSSNQLADKDFVNSSIATSTANFKGTFNTIEELEAVQNPTNNDYGFVIGTDQQGNTVYNRYKYNGTAWVFEYALNNSSFTASQWASINSGVTSADVSKLAGIETGAEANVNADWNATSGDAQILNKPDLSVYATNSALTAGLAAKQDTISDLATIRSGAAAGATAVQPGDLATVATTGDYDDLTNKPTIPTYSDFVGTDGTTTGTHGLVPAPATTDAGKYLKADGTWGTITVPQSGIPTDATFWGASYDATNNRVDGSIKLSSNQYDYLAKLGSYVFLSGQERVAIRVGNSTRAEFTAGDAQLNSYLNMNNYKIGNLADPTNAQNAATKNYVDTAVANAPTITMTTTDPGEGAPLAANNFIAVY